MNVTPDNNIAPVPPSPPKSMGDTPAERYLAYLDYAFSPEIHRRRYAVTASLLAASILLTLAIGYVADTRYPMAWFALPIAVGFVGRALVVMHKMVRRAQQYQRRKQVARKGDLVTAYLVAANTSLLRPGAEPALPCRVLFSFQPEVGGNAQYMRYLASRVAALRDKPTRFDMDTQYIAALASENRSTPNRRHILPLSFTDGSTVYMADLFVSRVHLPGGYLHSDAVACLAEAGPTGGIEVLPEWLLEPNPAATLQRAVTRAADPDLDDAPFPLD